MKDLYTAERILQIAMELEETGQVFYEAAAFGCPRENRRTEQLFEQLARDEKDHRDTFERMLNDLPEESHQAAGAFSNEQRRYIQKLINERIMPDPAGTLTKARDGNLVEALREAVEMERESVTFYTGILLTVTDELAGKVVRRIIDAEREHERDLLEAIKHA